MTDTERDNERRRKTVVQSAPMCGCMKCSDRRTSVLTTEERVERIFSGGPLDPHWRYFCEICGNKRCPHHSDHELACTNSNEPGQPGSVY